MFTTNFTSISLDAVRNEENLLAKCQVPVFRKVDNSIHWINHYPADSTVCFDKTYPLDSDLFSG